MSILYNRLSELCEQRAITGYRMAKDTNISTSLMTDLKMGRKKSISAEVADKLAAYFEVSVGYLLGTEDDPGIKKAPVQPDGGEEESMQLFRQLSPEVQERELAYLRQLAAHEAAQDK